jgi:hypothetical protein
MSSAVEEMLAKVRQMPAADKKVLGVELLKATGKWMPSAGPQSQAYYSAADCLLFGGEPGGGKSQLLLGLAFTCHERSLIMRRQYGDLDRIIEDALKIHGSRDGFNGSSPPKLKISSRQLINFAAANRVGDEQGQMGKGHDLVGFDEATHFAESQIRFVMGWARTETEGQRVRTVLATNPPLTAEGLWVIKMFAPWLDPTYHNPAMPGELRWVVSDADGKDLWVSGPEDCREVVRDGRKKIIRPTSRTYIPSKVSDNPYYAATDYERNLDAMPEPYRSLLMGGFRTAFRDKDKQVLPTDWIVQAQARWQKTPPHGIPQCAIGVDGARVNDQSVLAIRHDGWYAPLIAVKGSETPHGTDLAALVLKHRRDNAKPVIDVQESVGAQAYAHLQNNGVECYAYRGIDKSVRRTKERQLGFVNKRSESYWRFREALDPGQDGGSPIALPDDPELVADLTAPTWELTPNGIKILPKDKLIEELGRSPDKGDAVVMAWIDGAKAVTHINEWRPDSRVGGDRARGGSKHPKVNLGPRRRR